MGEASWFLNWGEGRIDPGVGSEGWLGWSATLLVVLGAVPCFFSQHPAFALNSSEVAGGVLGFLYLLDHNLPQLKCTQLFLYPYSFFVSFAPGDVCPGASIAATATKGPGSPVQACILRRALEIMNIFAINKGSSRHPRSWLFKYLKNQSVVKWSSVYVRLLSRGTMDTSISP